MLTLEEVHELLDAPVLPAGDTEEQRDPVPAGEHGVLPPLVVLPQVPTETACPL